MNNNKGFTLIELIVTIGILSISLVPLSSMFIQSAKVNSMTSENYDATLVAQHYFEEIESIEDESDAGVKGYTYDSSIKLFTKDISDGKFNVSIRLEAVSGTENQNTVNTFKSLTDECNILIKFNENKIWYDDLAISDVNSGLSQPITLVNTTDDIELIFSKSDDKLYIKDGNISIIPTPIDISGYSFYNIGVEVSHDMKFKVTNELEGAGSVGEIVFYPVINSADEHTFTIEGLEGRIIQKTNLYEGNISQSSESILYDVTIAVSRDGEDVMTFSGIKAFDE